MKKNKLLSGLNIDYSFCIIILLLTIGKVLVTKSIGCPLEFDCNSYIHMVDSLAPNADIPGHHAMRIFPVVLVKILLLLPFTIEQCFHILSAFCYIVFGILAYLFLRYLKMLPPFALAWTILLLSLHRAMIIPLYLVYQTADALVYPIGLGIIFATYVGKVHWTFALTILGILTRQNLLVLGLLSLFNLGISKKNKVAFVYSIIVTLIYFALQKYYNADNMVHQTLLPSKDFFSLKQQLYILKKSEFLDLWISIIPFLILLRQTIYIFFKKHWHWTLYAFITVGQPYVAFHLTGNNFSRLALQGGWVLALGLACNTLRRTWPSNFEYLILSYSLAMFITWGVAQRWILAIVFLIMTYLWYRLENKSNCVAPNQVKNFNF